MEVTEEPTVEPTEEPPAEATEEPVGEVGQLEVLIESPRIVKEDPTASCEMSINEGGDTNPFTFSFAAINVTGVNSYEWLIDGALVSTAQSFNHVFPSTGTYGILLRCITSTLGTIEISGSVSIVSLPEARFDITPVTSGFTPLTVYTANTSTGQGLSFLWEVINAPAGAGPFSPSSAQDTSYTFTVPGIYRIRLTASNANGSSVFEQEVAVNERPPIVDFTVSPNSGALPLTVTLTPVIGTNSGPVTSWLWDFGDGTSSVLQGPHTVVFTAVGTYTIRLDYSGPGGSGFIVKQVVVVEDGGAIDADFTLVSQQNAGGGIELCLRNLSTGPIARNLWDFGDGSPVIENNSDVVCHMFATGGTYTVRLRAENAAGTVSSEAQRSYTLVAAPVAVINASATTITWGSTVNFDGSASTGVIDTYEWDFNGDGVTDATGETANGIPIGNIGGVMRLGANPVRLTVTGPGGSSFVEAIIVVERLGLTCDFSGPLSVVPLSGAQNYTSSVGSINGRTVTYHWSLTGPGVNAGFATPNISYAFTNEGTYTLTLSASTPDGASCSTTKTITVAWPALTCNLTGDFNPLPNGTNYTYTMNVTGLAGRTATYDWYIGGSLLQSGPSNTFSRSWMVNNTVEELRVVVTPSAGTGCDQTRTITAAYRALTCSISGNAAPRPNMPSDPGGVNNYTYSAVTGNVDGRPLTYTWTIDGVAAGSSSSVTRNWDWTQIGESDAFALTVVADNGDGTFDTCNASDDAQSHVRAAERR